MFRFLNNKKVSKSLSSLLLFVILFNNIIFPSKAFALTAGPTQPEYSSFDGINANEMVNMFTGDFSYNIPLMDVDGYPVNISYHASPTMDQEASWTGLGWNINSGSINRGMRGLPDDFNGEEIKREINIADFKAWGVGIGGGVEITGKDLASLGLSGGIGVSKSNYKGVGFEIFLDATMAANVGDKTQGSLTAGLGLKASSTDGVDIYPQLGIGGQYRNSKMTSSIGLNVGAPYNSRTGAQAINVGVSVSASKGKYDKANNSLGNGHYKNSGIGIGIASSASIPISSQGYLPQMANSMHSQSYSLDFKMGGNFCVVAPFGYVKGYYAQNGIATNNVSLAGYGYLNSQNGDRNALHDFSREKDGMMYPETPNLPVTNYTYDMFYASAQGLEAAFRPHRNDIGMLYDNATTESSFGIGASGEVLIVPDANVGVNVNTHWSNGQSGRWEDNNDMLNSATFSSADNVSDYEPAYFKVAGEKTADDNAFLSSILNETAAEVQLESVSSSVWHATSNLTDNGGSNIQAISSGARKTKRAVRNNLVTSLTATEAQYAAVEKGIQNYKPLFASSFTNASAGAFLNTLVNTNDPLQSYGELAQTARYSDINRMTQANSRGNHISELTVTNTGGRRFVYGIPVYNKEQNEAMFNISGANRKHSDAAAGLIDYTSPDNTLNNAKGLDHFYEKNIIPGYAHSYLLTEVLSSDYVDRTGNGPSQDDYGDYTKFNYSDMGEYKWRIPYQEKKAIFNQGFLSDRMDDKASYLYGKKELWMPHSIETKNFIAFFVLSDAYRKDGYGTAGENGGRSTGEGTGAGQYYLQEIRLYAKKNFGPNVMKSAMPDLLTEPVKVVHFEYDYSLCPGVPNNINTITPGTAVFDAGVPTNGKLTLKKIYFTQGRSGKGSLTPYTFTYCDGNYSYTGSNPTYDPSSVDRWGYYKLNVPGDKNNIDFPYSTQDKSQADMSAAAWSLTDIRTPAGSKIKVTYEADDYGYVQDKQATQMYNILGMSNSATGSLSNTLYDNQYLFIDLSPAGAAGVPISGSGDLQVLKDKFFKGMDKLYIKACVQLTPSDDEFVPLYADIDDIALSNAATYIVNGTGYYKMAVVKLKNVGINDAGDDTQINPISKASFQLGRMYLPGVVFPGSQPNGSDHQVIKGLATLVQDMKSMFSGINKALYNRNIAKTFSPGRSVARLYTAGNKLGGGSRVSKITINDSWNTMSGTESSSDYGQQYFYTTTDGGTTTSGVASYEPMNGGDENTNRKPVEFSIKRVMAPNDEYFQEEPVGESFFPDPLVGYSKVIVKNLDHSADNVHKHATGRSEYEFYTARDFPVQVSRTSLSKQPVKPKLLRSLLKFGSTNKLYMSQGFVIKTNDMHGKPKAQSSFAENMLKPFSSLTYYYRTKTGSTNQLNNSVSVINASNVTSTKTIGQTTDFVTDSRSAVSNMWGAGVSVNVNEASCSWYIPLVFVWPSFSHEAREFYSITATKVISQYGLVDRVVAVDNSSKVETRNMLYDEETGEVVLTKTKNDFDADVYSLNYPAYWGYNRMGHAYTNAGIRLNASNGVYGPSNGGLGGSYFVPGDEVMVEEPGGIFTKTWVVQTPAYATYLVRADGSVFTSSASVADIYLKIIRSGRRNNVDASMGSLTSLQNPSPGAITAATKVLNASAVEYSDNWHTILGDMSTTTTQGCSCVVNNPVNYQILCDVIQTALTDMAYSPALVSLTALTPPNTTNGNNGMSSLPGSGAAGYAYNVTASPQSPKPALYNFCNAVFGSNPCFNMANYPYVSFDMTRLKEIAVPTREELYLQFTLVYGYGNPHPYPGGACSGAPSASCQFKLFSLTMPPSTSFNNWTKIAKVDNFKPVNNPCAYSGPPLQNGNNPYCISFDCYQYGATSPTFTGYAFTDCLVTYSGCTSWSTSSSIVCGKQTGNVVNPYVENIRGCWRPKADYSYLTSRYNNNDIKTDGYFTAFKPFYKYGSGWQSIPGYNSGSYDNWKKNSETEFINQYGNAVQAKNGLDIPSSTLYGYNHTLPVAIANNARQSQIAFDGFEDYEYMTGLECGALVANSVSGYVGHFNFYNNKSVLLPGATVKLENKSAHTGRYSLSVPKKTSSTQSKAVINRKFNLLNPAAQADDVPYTIKSKDNTGLFGPIDYAAGGTAVNQAYIASVWVQEVDPEQLATQSYGINILTRPQTNDFGNNAKINVLLKTTVGTSAPTVQSLTSGLPKKSPVINGWQKLEYMFTVTSAQASATGNKVLTIELENGSTTRTYLFDDVRIQPFNSQMKAMVYDPLSLKLISELDENNFATFYEYDEEGALVRSNKETEKGIYTLKEARSGLKK